MRPSERTGRRLHQNEEGGATIFIEALTRKLCATNHLAQLTLRSRLSHRTTGSEFARILLFACASRQHYHVEPPVEPSSAARSPSFTDRVRAALRRRLWIAERLRPSAWQITLTWAALAGFIGALSGILFQLMTHHVHVLLTGSVEGVVASMRELPWWGALLLPAIGGGVAGTFLWFGKRYETDGGGDYMEAIVIGRGTLPVRGSLLKSVAAMFVIGSGGSVGHEGPLVQLSALAASLCARWRNVSADQKTLLIACGAAAGIATAYRAPIAGSFFIAEIVLGTIAMDTLGPLVVSSVVAALTFRTIMGRGHLYDVPPFELVSAWEMVPYTLLGLLLGALAPWFRRSLRWADRLFKATRLPMPARLAFGGLIVGALAIRVPEVGGNGYAVVVSILQGNLGWQFLLLVLACKWLATSASVGSGAPGGVLTPSLFVGASTGYLFGSAVHQLLPIAASEPRNFALVGMGAFLAASIHAPLVTVLLLFEMTLSYDILLPLMLGTVVAYFTSKSIDNTSLYSDALARKRHAAPTPSTLTTGVVADVMHDDPPVVGASASFAELARLFFTYRVNHVYVVDAEHRFVGAVSLHDIKPYLNGNDLDRLFIAHDAMHVDIPRLAPDTALTDAIKSFVRWSGERLPVVEPATGRLRGSVAKSDLLLVIGKWTSGGNV